MSKVPIIDLDALMGKELHDVVCASYRMGCEQTREVYQKRIEKLEAGEIEFDRVIGNYASENAQFRDRIEKLEAAVKKVLSQCSWYRTDQWCAGLDCRCIVLVSAMQEELNTSKERVNKTGEI